MYIIYMIQYVSVMHINSVKYCNTYEYIIILYDVINVFVSLLLICPECPVKRA